MRGEYQVGMLKHIGDSELSPHARRIQVFHRGTTHGE